MTTLGSTLHQGGASHYRPSERAGTGGLTDSQRFTKEHAHLSASEYIFAELAFSEQQSAGRIASGEADHTFQVRFKERIFTIAGNRLDVSLLNPVRDVDVQLAYARTETSGQPSDASASALDFSKMSRRDLADVGKELFHAGKITLDELFVMEHPDGVLRIDANGKSVTPDPNQRIDFLTEIRAAIRDLEQAGSSQLPGSIHDTMAGLLSKIANPV